MTGTTGSDAYDDPSDGIVNRTSAGRLNVVK
jgi:hypothetical protein